MSLLHLRTRRLLGLLASGVLPSPQRERALAHVEACARCRGELEELRGTLALLEEDPVRGAEPPLPPGAVFARVRARLDEAQRPAPAPVWRWTLAPLAAVAALAVALLVPWTTPRPPAGTVSVSDEVLARLEGNLAREQAARYLGEAQDVLVTMAALPIHCAREPERVDVTAETERSRQLLARRALLVEVDRARLASARPVLDDVEDLLREVASLESCVRLRDVERLRQRIERRQLLMKIRLTRRELEG